MKVISLGSASRQTKSTYINPIAFDGRFAKVGEEFVECSSEPLPGQQPNPAACVF